MESDNLNRDGSVKKTPRSNGQTTNGVDTTMEPPQQPLATVYSAGNIPVEPVIGKTAVGTPTILLFILLQEKLLPEIQG